jgi:hypothetical protein
MRTTERRSNTDWQAGWVARGQNFASKLDPRWRCYASFYATFRR